jgi:hypothetical protein
MRPIILALSLLTASTLIAQQPAITEHSGTLALHATIASGKLQSLRLRNTATARSLDLGEAFLLVQQDGTTIRSTQLHAAPLASTEVTDPHRELSTQSTTPHHKSCLRFTGEALHGTADWCIVTGTGDYLRTLLKLTAGTQDLPISEVRLLDFSDATAHVEGTVKGSPIVDATMFFGLEHPLSISTVTDGTARVSMPREIPLRAGTSVTYSAVIGAATPGRMRQDFLHYLESERPRKYAPFLHYNSWYDLGYGNRFDEAGALNRIHAFGDELTRKRGVKLSSFLFDDGWDNTHSLWGFDSGFPNGFTKASAAAKTYGAGVGVWMSPWGGYQQEKKERIEYGTTHGYEIVKGGYALSGPKYYAAFEKTCLDMIQKYDVNQFKFDGTGNVNSVYPGSSFDSDFIASIHLIEVLRHAKPSVFINLTTGTTASPFWVFYADSIWRGGEDHSFAGEGSWRQRWITYRDSQTYKSIVERGPLFPLNSLMLHGIIYADKAAHLTDDPQHDFADEVHSYFGSGTQLQEMYITPSLLSKEDWDTLAASAKWSRANAATLVDTHWIGGDPAKGEVYGWAAANGAKAIVTLRNPSPKAQEFELAQKDIYGAVPNAPSTHLRRTWPTPNTPDDHLSVTLKNGHPEVIALHPFEVLTLETITAK